MPRPMGRGKGAKDPKRRERGNNLFKRKKFCRFTAEGVKEIDYKDIDVLKDFIQENGKIMAKLLAADASWEAANVCLQTFGGFGFAADYDVERKFRETRLYQVAPISTNLILTYVAEHVLGLPRSY